MSKRRYDTHERSPDGDSDDGYRDRERKSSRKESYSDRNSYKSKSAHVKEKYDRNENDSRKDYRTDSVNRQKGSSLEKDVESYRKTTKRKKTQYSSEDENLSYNSKNSERRKESEKDKEDNRTENEIDSDRDKVKKLSKKYSERRTGFILDDDSLKNEKCAVNDNREKMKSGSKKHTERRTGFIIDTDSSGNEKMNDSSRSKASKKYSEESSKKHTERRTGFIIDTDSSGNENMNDNSRSKASKKYSEEGSKKHTERSTGFIIDTDSSGNEKMNDNSRSKASKRYSEEGSKKHTERRTGFIIDTDSSGNEKMNDNSGSKASKKYSEEAQSKTHTDVIGKDNYRGNERKRNYYEKNSKTSMNAKDSSSEDGNKSYGSKSRDKTNYSEKILSKVTAVDKDNKHYTSKERYSGKITENRKTVVDYSSEDEDINYSRGNKERSKYSEKTSKSSKISEEDDDYYKIKSKERKGTHSKRDSENKRSHIDAVESLSEGEIYSSREIYSDKIKSKVITAGEDDHYRSKEEKNKNKHSDKKVIEIDITNNSTDDENYNSRKKERKRYSDKIRNKTSIDVEGNERRNRGRKESYSEKNRTVVDISNDSSGNEKYNRKRTKHSDQMKSKIDADDSEDNHYRGKEERRIHSEKHRSVVDKESSSEDEDYYSKNKDKAKYSGKIRSKVTSNVQDSPYRDGKRKDIVPGKGRRVVDISDSSCEEENTNNGSKNRPREKSYENEGSKNRPREKFYENEGSKNRPREKSYENEGRHNRTWSNFEDNSSRSTDRRWKHLEKDTGKKNAEVDSESEFGNNKSKTDRQAEKLQQNVSSNEPQSKRVQIATINMRTGGAYIPPARLKMMQDQIKDKGSTEYQRIAWEALKKSIVGMTNKVNISNIADIVPELLKENIIRGRGVLARAVMQAQAASPSFTRVYSALVAIINTKFPEIGELILKRLILQYRRGFRRNDKTSCLAACRFIAQLFNQEVAHEILILEIATHLLEIPTEDSVEIAIAFLKECGQKLTQLSKNGMRAITDRIRDILHDSKIDARIRYMIEVYHAIQKDKFQSFQAVEPELDLVEESDKYTHLLNLDETVDGQDILNVFKFDPEYLENEEKYKSVVKEILGDSSGSEASGEDSDEEDKEGEGEGGEQKAEAMEITDMTETNVVCLRRKIYLTIQSSLDFEECAHKLLKLEFKPGQIVEMCYMILDCCAQQRTYEKFFGLLAQRFCQINKIYAEPFTDIFENSYKTIHRLETNKLRNVANFFAHLLYTDAISWMVLSNIRLNEEETTSSSRVFIKILFQELCEYMGLKKLNERVQDVTFQEAFEGLFPRDHPHNTRFAINFFTSIGLGGLTDELREHLKNAPKKQAPPPPVPEVDSGVPQSSESDSESSESEEERNARKRKKKSKKKKK